MNCEFSEKMKVEELMETTWLKSDRDKKKNWQLEHLLPVKMEFNL